MFKKLMDIPKSKFKFKLGERVRDTITGFEGVVVCSTRWLNGCNTYGLQPLELKDGVPQERLHFDEPQMESVSGKTPVVPNPEYAHGPGGDARAKAPSMNRQV